MVEHIVLFRFLPDTPTAKIDEILTAQLALKNQVDGILCATAGADVTGRAQGFTHCAHLTFESQDSLAAFYPSPAHQGGRPDSRGH